MRVFLEVTRTKGRGRKVGRSRSLVYLNAKLTAVIRGSVWCLRAVLKRWGGMVQSREDCCAWRLVRLAKKRRQLCT